MTREELQKKLIDAPDSEKINELFDDFQKNVKLDSEVDSWLSKNYQSLKELSPDLGKEAFKAKPSVANSEADLVKMFGLEGDEGAKQLFSTGEKSWAKVPQWRKEQIAKDNGMEWPELKAKLVDADKAYNEAVRKKNVESMIESEMSPKFTDNPLDFIAINTAKMFIPNIVEGAIEDAKNGTGATGGRIDFIKDQFENHKKDLLADALITGASFIPVGSIAKSKGLVGSVGKILVEGVHQGANSAASESAGYVLHDKAFDPNAVLFGLGTGALLETSPKQVSDMAKGFFKQSPTVKKVANAFEHAFTDYAENASEYMKDQRRKVSSFKNKKNDPGDGLFKRTTENYKNNKISFEDLEKAKEAEALYDYIKTGRRPVNKNGEYVSENELQEMFLRHEPLNEFDASIMRGDSRNSFLSPKSNVKKIVELAPETIKAFLYNPSNEEDSKRKDDVKKISLYKKFEKGELPRSPSDPDWKTYQEWANENPRKNEQAKLLALFSLK